MEIYGGKTRGQGFSVSDMFYLIDGAGPQRTQFLSSKLLGFSCSQGLRGLIKLLTDVGPE